MKNIIFLLVIILFASCSKRDDATLRITDSQWYLTRNILGGGEVNLKISGSTNGDKVTVRTYGDGVIFDENVELDNNRTNLIKSQTRKFLL
jgi:hypothetical protein